MSAAGTPADNGALELSSPAMAVTIAPRRGAEIRSVSRPGGPNVLFHADWEAPVRASRSGGYPTGEQDWLSEWRGGWQELFPNAGAPGDVMGVPLPFHGEASASQWSVSDVGDVGVTLLTGTRLPVVLERRMELDEDRPVLRVTERVVNESALPVPIAWGHHPAFHALPGSRIDLPAGPVTIPRFDVGLADLEPGSYQWPRVGSRRGGTVDLSIAPDGPVERVAYLPDRPEGWVALRRPDGVGVALSFDHTVFRHLWMWTEIGGTDFPWYGRSQVLALEPVSIWPNDGLAAAIGRGQQRVIPPQGELTSWLTMTLFDAGDAPVTSVDRAGNVLTG